MEQQGRNEQCGSPIELGRVWALEGVMVVQPQERSMEQLLVAEK